ncbi:hypothetical protein D9757_007211 [Collybiopsis confluens]|uniref:Crossover junction endonuclease MUS81 n=1 Tax=Collybiopsis confluens TaxID=2823264 RepID=A0A8H5HAZ9_9AGAR|nr:hypothetical protein D9757_007211 [Collybiopsis confluens]
MDQNQTPDGAQGTQKAAEEAERRAQEEELRRNMMATVLDNGARERLSRISLVSPERSRQIETILLRMAQSGQLRGRVTEDQLIELLDQVRLPYCLAEGIHELIIKARWKVPKQRRRSSKEGRTTTMTLTFEFVILCNTFSLRVTALATARFVSLHAAEETQDTSLGYLAPQLMPPKINKCKNPVYYSALIELRDAADPSRKKHEDLSTPEDAFKVPFVGKTLVAALSEKLRSTHPTSADPMIPIPNPKPAQKAPGRPRNTFAMADISTPVISQVTPTSQSQVQSSSDVFQFCYLSRDDQVETRVRYIEEAYLEVKLTSGPGYYIEFPRSCRHRVLQEIAYQMPQANTIRGYLPMDIGDAHYPESTLPLDWQNRSAAAPIPGSSRLKRSATDIIAADIAQASSSVVRRSQTMSDMPPPSYVPISASASTSQIPLRRTDSTPTGTQSSPKRRTQTQAARPRPRLSHALAPPPADFDIDIEDPYASADHVDFPDFQPTRIPWDQCDVFLLLDTREIKSQVDRSGIYDGLVRQGVKVIRRSLNVGDVSWIAKRKPEFCDGSEHDEIALDCILERKRIDDLSASIEDGRFHDQKVGLFVACGELSLTFTISGSLTEIDLEQAGVSEELERLDIDTAITETSDTDRFHVKETRSIHDTIKFYVRLHKEVVLRYQHQDLYVIPSELVKRHSYLKFQKELRRKYPEKDHLLSYNAFSSLNLKSGFITVRETWAKMILCFPRMSAEKAGFLIHYFPTPASMYRACLKAVERQRQDDEDAEVEERRTGKPRKKKDIFVAEEFLKDFGGNTDRNIGRALSKNIFRVMMQRGEYTT